MKENIKENKKTTEKSEKTTERKHKNLITLEEIKTLIDESEQETLCPVCVPSYKFRDDSWFVHNLDKIDAPVYLFVYEDDYTASNYDKYNWSDNVTIVKIKEEDFLDLNIRWRGIQPKRKYIQLYMNNLGIEKYFMIDDDLHEYLVYPESKIQDITYDKYRKGLISINTGLKVMLRFLNKYNYTNYKVVGIRMGEVDIEYCKLRGICDDYCPTGFYLFNNNKILFNDGNLHEDHQLYIDCKKNDNEICLIDFLSDQTLKIENESTCESNDLNINDYLANPCFVDFHKINPSKPLLFTFLNIEKIRCKNTEKDETLYNIALSRDVNKLTDYINFLYNVKRYILLSENCNDVYKVCIGEKFLNNNIDLNSFKKSIKDVVLFLPEKSKEKCKKYNIPDNLEVVLYDEKNEFHEYIHYYMKSKNEFNYFIINDIFDDNLTIRYKDFSETLNLVEFIKYVTIYSRYNKFINTFETDLNKDFHLYKKWFDKKQRIYTFTLKNNNINEVSEW